MIPQIKQTRRWLFWGAYLIGLMGQVACSSDDEAFAPVEPLAPVEVRLQVVAESPGAAMAVGKSDVKPNAAETGTEHEYIHSLCVCVVNDKGQLEAKILPTNLPVEANKGNLKTYVSEPLKLNPGQKTLLAFANWETVENTTWNSLIGLGLYETVALDTYDSLMIDDPASRVNFTENRFIPMSGKETVTVTKNTRSLRVGLERLVAKMRVSVSPEYSNDNETITLTSFSISGFADKVPLFSTNTQPTEFKGEYTHSFGEQGLTLTKPQQVAEFYVNATQRCTQGGFQVKVQTRQFSGMTYEAVTSRTEVPRNSIYPLNVVLNNYKLDITAEAWRAPIGAEPRPYQVTADGSYLIKMMDVTSKFRITPEGINLGQSFMQDVKWQWKYEKCTVEGDASGIDKTETYPIEWNEKSGSVEGRFGANETKRNYHFLLNAQWQYEDRGFNRTYKVIIQVVQDYMPFLPQSTTAKQSLCLPEVLTMFAQ